MENAKKINKRIKQFENIISNKKLSLNELKAISWNGIPFGKYYLNKV